MAPDDAWRMAVHEVAHGLLYRVHGGRVTALEVYPWPREDGTAAACTGVCSREIRATGGLRRLVHDAMVHVAGIEGERLVYAAVDARQPSSDLERFEATLRQILALGADGTPLEVWDRAIRRLVTQVLRRHHGILLEVATALTEVRRLDESHAMAVFARAERRWGLEPGPLAGEDWAAAVTECLDAIRPIGEPRIRLSRSLACHASRPRQGCDRRHMGVTKTDEREMRMDSVTVRAAVRELRAREERVSVRAVHALTGGSFRDISRLLREARDYLADDEVVALEAEAAEPSAAPVPGRLVAAHEASLAADATVGEAQAGLDAAVARVRALRARRPPDATSPEAVAAVVQAQLAHDAEVAALGREVEQWQRLVEARRLEAQGAKEAWRTVQLRVRHFRDDVVPPMRQRLQEAQHDLERLERDTAHQLQLARNRVESLTRALAVHEAELQALMGDARPDQARR